MKKLFGMIAILLLFSSVVFGETTKLSETQIKHNNGNDVVFAVRTICVDGYKFVVTRDIETMKDFQRGGTFTEQGNWGTTSVSISTTVSTVQFYENQNGKAVPAKC